ncbi:MAG: helix-turn-helix transcriptional regulator [Rhodoferax sp.]|uniref:helix-turn-helix transcriptional regulator n=1 Tax=Rhodoferax sp. TaxID=50421 RepID=UPI003267073B
MRSNPSGEFAQLRALSASLLKLADLARSTPTQTMLQESLEVLRALVSFDSAWWGEVSDFAGDAAPQNWLNGSIGLAQSFAQEWNQISARDDFALQSIAQLGVVVRLSDADDAQAPPPEVAAFSQRHGLYHCMAITATLPHSGLMFFVSVYRSKSHAPFTAVEEVLFGAFVSHLLHHWRYALERLQVVPPSRAWDSHALADPSGRLLFVGLRIAQALKSAYPQWPGSVLPYELQSALRDRPSSFLASRSCRLRLEPCGPLIAISLPSSNYKSLLSPRELGAATLYASGHSNKEIAATLGLTPTTVRTYLRSAYAQLGVHNKLELFTALRKA